VFRLDGLFETGTKTMSGCVALIVGAGRGKRFGGETPKQYLDLAGQPVVRRTVRAFLDHPGVDAICPVIHPDDRDLFEAAVTGLDGVLAPVNGGASRQDSVRLGLDSLSDLAPDKVLIHDSVRPFVDKSLISRVLSALDKGPGAVPALPVVDTLKRGRNGVVEETLPRESLWRAQTPQGFRYRDILSAHHQMAGSELTDDAAVAEKAALLVAIVPGSEENIKVTTPEDLTRAERKLSGSFETRVGYGFDVHRFCPGDQVMLCGISVPFEAGLEGHSDADVGLHAMTDAIMGAIGAGDIGSHFPPEKSEWRNAPSDIFLRKAGELVAAHGGRIINLDVTLVCEKPKISPHRDAMVRRVAEILELEEGRVSIKGTTTERLGFTGRGEGIAAQAVATIQM
jgi:2-C-methyl-D-erythritol 4-phosphate cytidylyltransferase / 2-C-methyl-D-erythritol 2,4-cyclodiphosphate synthase